VIESALRDAAMVGGCFRLEIVPRRWIYGIRDTLGDGCVDMFKVALGDRGFFCRRESFFAAGQYPDQPLLEDADFYCQLRRLGGVKRLNAKIQTSAPIRGTGPNSHQFVLSAGHDSLFSRGQDVVPGKVGSVVFR
jgi:hypothetical protein